MVFAVRDCSASDIENSHSAHASARRRKPRKCRPRGRPACGESRSVAGPGSARRPVPTTTAGSAAGSARRSKPARGTARLSPCSPCTIGSTTRPGDATAARTARRAPCRPPAAPSCVPGASRVGAGDRVRLDLPGGGHGDPHERPIETIATDIAEGYVTAAAARALYGVEVEGAGAVSRQAPCIASSAIRDCRLPLVMPCPIPRPPRADSRCHSQIHHRYMVDLPSRILDRLAVVSKFCSTARCREARHTALVASRKGEYAHAPQSTLDEPSSQPPGNRGGIPDC